MTDKPEINVNPDYEIIGKYYSAYNIDRFKSSYDYYNYRGIVSKLLETIIENGLQNYSAEILFFTLEAAQNYTFSEFASENSLANENYKYATQSTDLLVFLKKVHTGSGYHKRENKLSTVKSITITTENNKSIKINSHLLCYDLLTEMYKALQGQEKEIKQKALNPPNIKRSQFDKNFILKLNPFVNYLNNDTIKWKSKNKIYAFICDLLILLPHDINIDPVRIKDVFSKVVK